MPQAALRSNEVLQSRRARQNMRRGRTISPGARGAKPLTPHGPLQRLLGGTVSGARINVRRLSPANTAAFTAWIAARGSAR